MLTAIGAGTIVLAGVAWLWGKMSVIQSNPLYWQAGMAVAMIAVFGALLFWVLNKPNVVDFMIATEAEMRKVNWPSRREIIGSTVVVISGTLMLALLLWLINLGLGSLFLWMNVLEG
jgi:preprotein translocase subunit SecE